MIIPEIDRKAFDTLAGELLQVIRAHYLRRPQHKATVFEVLNALASVTAYVIAATAPDHLRIRVWFNQALSGQTDEIQPGGSEPGERH
jgi:hypothetical protein